MDSIDELYHFFPQIKERIKVVKKVGQGTFSYVYFAHLIDNEDEKFALKYVIPTSSPSRTKQEIECLLKIGGHGNVIGVHAVLRHKSHVIILMPYVEHVSFNETYMDWDVDEIRDYMKNLLISLDRVHKFNIIHRDIKPSNFLYALVDFGLAQVYEKTIVDLLNDENKLTASCRKSFSSNLITANNTRKQLINKNPKSSSPIIASNPKSPNTPNTPRAVPFQKYYSFHKNSFNLTPDSRSNTCMCFNMPTICDICTSKGAKWAPRAGTAGFRSPEVLFRFTNQTTAVDCWAAGIILLSLLSGRYPFFKSTDDCMAIMQLVSVFGSENIRKNAIKYGETIVCDVEKDSVDLKHLCVSLRKTPLDFPDSVYNLLNGLLELNFEKRLSAEEALKHAFFTDYK